MGSALDFSQGMGRKELETARRRFLALNQTRLERLFAELNGAQQELLNLLPLLLHVNHAALPAYAGNATPAGIADYTPANGQLMLAKRHHHGFQYQRRRQLSPPILGLYLMGSVGTIAHSRGSDLDFWLCHHQDLEPAALALLAEKARLLEEFAAGLGLEMHFFLMDVEKFRGGDITPLSSESSGSTQHRLLLEEFYRSAMLLAGRAPLWWMCPPGQDADYTRFTADLLHRRHVTANEYLDFGGLDGIAGNEFFGAGLWQLFKSLHSPYKSVLKILLTETYAKEFPRPDWLALRIKRGIYQGNTDAVDLDAYLLMYRKVEEMLLREGHYDRLDLARRCLYFKVNEPLTRQKGAPGWRAAKMTTLVRQWGWDEAQLQDLDRRPSWKISRVLQERGDLVRELNRSYRLLSEFAMSHGHEIQVQPAELNLLGRKLYTLLEDRPGKVDKVNPGISADLSEDELTLQLRIQDQQPSWHLYTGRIESEESASANAVKCTQGLVEILAWCLINGLSASHTRFHLIGDEAHLQNAEIGRINASLGQHLDKEANKDPPLENLSRPPWPLKVLVFVNLGSKPEHLQDQPHLQRISDRCDPLSYGAPRELRFHNLEMLTLTSWGELLTRRYADASGLLDALCHYLGMLRGRQEQTPPQHLHVLGHANLQAGALARRLEQWFGMAAAFFQAAPDGRYCLYLGDQHYLLQHGDTGYRWIEVGDEGQVIEVLSEPRHRYSPPGCDSQALRDSPLPTLFQRCQSGQQQLFHFAEKGSTRVFILDESGALFHQRYPVSEPNHLLLQLRRFLDSLARQRRINGMLEEAASLVTGPRFYRLQRDGAGWRISPTRLPSADLDFIDLRLVAESDGQFTRILSLRCGDHEYSVLKLGESVFQQTARHVLGMRAQSSARYPIYLTSIELIQANYAMPPGGVEMLQLKRRVENRLSLAQKQLLQTR